MKIFFFVIFASFLFNNVSAQTIQMDFPSFACKTYEFIIFQGDQQIIAQKDTIPSNGRFELKIPKEYTPYTGMCRWLITGTREGGGLDMAIPGYDFSVSCHSSQPNNDNIIYKNFDAVNELNRLNKEQLIIIDRYETITKAANLFRDNNKLYVMFIKEKQKQITEYNKFLMALQKNSNYNARFLPITNLVRGRPMMLIDDNEQRSKFINQYIVEELNFDHLFTSGHWITIIRSWVQFQTNGVNDKFKFVEDFKKITARISNPLYYTNFVRNMTTYLIEYGKDDFIEAIAQSVTDSKKITEFTGSLASYKKINIGTKAPDLDIVEYSTNDESNHYKIESKDFAKGQYNKTVLLFYHSDCDYCQELLQQLILNYDLIKKRGIDVYAIAADQEEEIFKKTASNFPWSCTFYDFKNANQVNFDNYAVIGTPTMFLIDKEGNIESKIVNLKEFLEK